MHVARPFCLAPGAVVVVASLTGLVRAREDDKGSPFTEVVTEGDSARVDYEGKTYELVELDGLKTKEILDFARETYGGRWEKRFAEDLLEVLTRMGHKPGTTMKLVLRDPKSGALTTVERAPVTEENRRAVWRARHRSGGLRPRVAAPMGKMEMILALDAFRRALEKRWSYLRPSKIDLGAAMKALRKRLEEGMSGDAFALELQKIIGHGIDGHARVQDVRTPGDCLGFLIEPVGKRYVAFHADRSRFVDAAHPFIERIDGVSIDAWIEKAGSFVPDGSPQYVRHQGLRWLRKIAFLRREGGLPESDVAKVELVSRDGKRRKTLESRLSSRSPVYGTWPRTPSRLLDGNVGYLRLASMDAAAPRDVRTWMGALRKTKGLVVDVRDNGGGSREALRVLHGYLLAPKAPPRVVNAAKYRLHPDHDRDHLEARFMHREAWAGWTPAHRRAIAAFKETFKPKWSPPRDEFSEWHYLVLDRLEAPAPDPYDRPVVVLMNAKCFSATDVFLAGLKGLPNVTLLGEPSGGGSARVRTVTLAPTALRVRIGSMVSYQVDGRLFDGQGVLPDERVVPAPDYFIGGRDSQLEAALERIEAKRKGNR